MFSIRAHLQARGNNVLISTSTFESFNRHLNNPGETLETATPASKITSFKASNSSSPTLGKRPPLAHEFQQL